MQDAPKKPAWVKTVLDAVWQSWQYRAPSCRLAVKAEYNKKLRVWELWVAPSVQELYGGAKDGDRYWPPFVFCATTFAADPKIEVTSSAVGSSCRDDEKFKMPQMMIRGKVLHGRRNYKFFLRVLLEAEKDMEPLEIIDTFTKKLRFPFGDPENG